MPFLGARLFFIDNFPKVVLLQACCTLTSLLYSYKPVVLLQACCHIQTHANSNAPNHPQQYWQSFRLRWCCCCSPNFKAPSVELIMKEKISLMLLWQQKRHSRKLVCPGCKRVSIFIFFYSIHSAENKRMRRTARLTINMIFFFRKTLLIIMFWQHKQDSRK